MSMLKILLVDDDPNIRQLLNLYLEKEGFEVTMASRGDEALKIFKTSPPNLMLLDIMLPGMDGWQVCREIREISPKPVIMITAKGEVFDKVLGLELGADDYIVKPFEPKELVARIKAVLRRCENGPAGAEEGSQGINFDGLSINRETYEVYLDDKRLELPPKEFELLYFLAQNSNKVFTRDQLLNEIWGYEFFGDSRTVDVHIKRIREKIEGDGKVRNWQLKTVWGVGYKFELVSK